MNAYKNKLKKLVEAFFEIKPRKSRLLMHRGGCWYHEKEFLSTPMRRDEVIVEGGTAKYLLWGEEIASWDGETLCLNRYNIHHTRLTANRLNNILLKFISNSIGFEYPDKYGDPKRTVWEKERRKFPYVKPRGFGFWFCWSIMHPYPLTIKASPLKVCFDKDIYIKKLLRTQTMAKEYIDLIKELKISIPRKYKDKVAAKMFEHTLNSYIAA